MARVIASIVLCAGLAACSTSGGLFGAGGSQSNAPQPSGGSASALNAEGLTVYLQTMRDLIEGDPVVQADTFRNAAETASFEPTTTNRLNYALALATPGHPSSNAAEAQRLLASLLAAGEALLPEERILAVVHLKEAEQRLILDAEAQRLQQEAVAATAQQSNQSAQRLQGLIEENRQLRLQLDEAREKLNAITNIERSIRERENGADSQ
jgi:hypothetical protein